MKSDFLKIASCVLSGVLLCSLAACKKQDSDESSDPYVYTPQGQSTVQAQSPADAEAAFTVDRSWQKNFSLQYKYYDRSQSTETAVIRETRTDDAFCAEYINNGDILYYKENGNDVDYYLIIKDAENVHSVVKGKSIDDLSSTFMKLSAVSSEIPSLSNAMYMNDENVGTRPCKKYIQRAYQGGKVQETVYIWVDKEFGFAAKGESFDADDKLKVSWELTLFKTGDVKDNAIHVNPAAYVFTEQ